MAKRSWTRIITEKESGHQITVDSWISNDDEFMLIMHVSPPGLGIDGATDVIDLIDGIIDKYGEAIDCKKINDHVLVTDGGD